MTTEPQTDNPIADLPLIEPGILKGDAPNNPNEEMPDAPKKRGRKPGSRNKESGYTGKAAKTDPMGIALIFSTVFEVIAGKFGDIWRLNGNESMSLGKAFANVLDQYSVDLNPRTAAWLTFMSALIAVIGGRIMIIKMMQSTKPDNLYQG